MLAKVEMKWLAVGPNEVSGLREKKGWGTRDSEERVRG